MYNRPKITYTDTLQTKDSIKKLLENYKKISDQKINNLENDAHIRYITTINGQKKIRIGRVS